MLLIFVRKQTELSICRIFVQLFESEEGWAVSCSDLPGCHSEGRDREDALNNIRESISLWLEVEAEEAGIRSVEILEVAV